MPNRDPGRGYAPAPTARRSLDSGRQLEPVGNGGPRGMTVIARGKPRAVTEPGLSAGFAFIVSDESFARRPIVCRCRNQRGAHDTFVRSSSTIGSGRPFADCATTAGGASLESRRARHSVTRVPPFLPSRFSGQMSGPVTDPVGVAVCRASGGRAASRLSGSRAQRCARECR